MPLLVYLTAVARPQLNSSSADYAHQVLASGTSFAIKEGC
jgi:hypothetical protein